MFLAQVELAQKRMLEKVYLKLYRVKKKRVLVTSFASNVARMESIFYIAKQTKRSISLVGRSMNRIYKAAKQCGYFKNVIEPVDS